ncbi:hypothetical protein H920_08342 [Fukomys damarensis]|uniref:Uncharacterized protein n=1 Tax=Fukomys damarensis TaxID=885580 RepID=A0A091DDN3_FUKDA|nr:hypothetical protein H920_08342 [Fukomys damarensis]
MFNNYFANKQLRKVSSYTIVGSWQLLSEMMQQEECPGSDEEKLAVVGFLDANLAVLIRGGALGLAVTGNGCRSHQGIPDEHYFLAPVQIPQLGGTDSSPHCGRLSSFHWQLLDLPGAEPRYRLV